MISGKVLSTSIDDNGNIKVKTEYTLTDGTKTTGHTRYNCFNFSQERVLADIQAHCETLMRRVYALKKNPELVTQDLTGIFYNCSSLIIDINGVDTTIDDK